MRTTRTKQEEMGDETMDIQEAVEENIQGRTTSKTKVPAERFSASLTDLKLVHDTQIPWGQLHTELSKSRQVMEFAWKDATVVLFMSTVHDGEPISYSMAS